MFDRLDEWCNTIIRKLDSIQKSDDSISDYFFMLDAAVSVEKLRSHVVERDYHFQIYEGLKIPNPTSGLLRPLSAAALPLIIQFVGKCSLHSAA